MKLYKLQKLQQKRQFVAGRYLVGIDPAKARHQAQILAPDGLPVDSTFAFNHSFAGFHHHCGCRVVLVNPLSTCHARPAKSGDFSHEI